MRSELESLGITFALGRGGLRISLHAGEGRLSLFARGRERRNSHLGKATSLIKGHLDGQGLLIALKEGRVDISEQRWLLCIFGSLNDGRVKSGEKGYKANIDHLFTVCFNVGGVSVRFGLYFGGIG